MRRVRRVREARPATRPDASRPETPHEKGEPVVHVVDVVGHRQQPESGEDGEEGGHGAGDKQDDHDHHLKNKAYFIVVQLQTCFVTELLSLDAKARKAAAAVRKTRPPVIPSPSTTLTLTIADHGNLVI